MGIKQTQNNKLILQVEAFVLNRLAFKPSSPKDLCSAFSFYTDGFFLFDDTINLVISNLLDKGLIRSVENSSTNLCFSTIKTDELPIFSFKGGSSQEVISEYEVRLYNNVSEAPFDEVCLVSNGGEIGIFYKPKLADNTTETNEFNNIATEIVNSCLNADNGINDSGSDSSETTADSLLDGLSMTDTEVNVDNSPCDNNFDFSNCLDNPSGSVATELPEPEVIIDEQPLFSEQAFPVKDEINSTLDKESNCMAFSESKTKSTVFQNTAPITDTGIEVMPDKESNDMKIKSHSAILHNEDAPAFGKTDEVAFPSDMQNSTSEKPDEAIIFSTEEKYIVTSTEPDIPEPIKTALPLEDTTKKDTVNYTSAFNPDDAVPKHETVMDENRIKRMNEAMARLGMLDDAITEDKPLVKSESVEAATATIESGAVAEEFTKQQELATASIASEKGDAKGKAYDMLHTFLTQVTATNSYNFQTILQSIFVDREQPAAVSSEESTPIIVASYSELKEGMSKKGWLVKPYLNQNTYSYYTDNYIFSSKISRDVSIVCFAFILIQIVLGYVFVDKYINIGYGLYLLLGLCSMIIPAFNILRYVNFKNKRQKANFHFRISLATALMLYCNIMVLVVLFAFFVPSLHVSTDDVTSMIAPIFYPAVLLLNIPISVCVYSILYRTKRYHLH